MIPLPSLDTDAPPLLSLHDVRVTRGGKPILTGITADVIRGRITALIGLNGSGKSTLLRTLVGEFPYTGRVEYRCGHDHSRPRPEYVGYVPQRLSIDSRLPLTVRDLMGLAMSKGPLFFGLGRKLSERIRVLLERVGVPHLLDVPAAGIDFKDQTKFYDLIARISREDRVTILLVSHDLSVVSRYAEHVLCLRDGKIQCQGHPQTVLTSDVLSTTFGAEMQAFAHHH
jgi:zinc transport system ATP-binding protein